MNIYRDKLKQLYRSVGQAFVEGAKGVELSHMMAAGVDDILISMWREKAPAADACVALVAVGGYGRGELAPYSDWDLWFLTPEQCPPELEQQMQDFLYALWDLKARIGHAVRSVSETLKHVGEDWNSATAAMDARLLSGNNELYVEQQSMLAAFFKKRRKSFVEAKLIEQEVRHARTGGTAFLMEPDIKEGQGGLRDVQSLLWMAKGWYGPDDVDGLVDSGALSVVERDQLLQSQDFLWRCRVGLHLEMNRASERLGFEQQVALAERMQYQALEHRPAVDAFMKDYFRHVGRISRISSMFELHFREALHPQFFSFLHEIGDGFTLEGKRVGLSHERVFQEDPLRLLRVFHVGQQGERQLSSQALRQIRADVLLIDDAYRANPEAHHVFLQILRSRRNVRWALKQMNDTGVLGRFIPEFREVVGLGQFNRYHAYTVDEHTIRAVGEARNIWHRERQERLPLAREVSYQINRPELLYIALIFHDIAKGQAGDHSENGAVLARNFCERIGLNRDAVALVEWLVREHLLMAVKSQRFDLTDPEVIKNFADRVGDMERLNYLLLLTVADIAAVGPNVWNDWKGSLLQELYESTAICFMGKQSINEAARQRYEMRMQTVLETTSGEPERIQQAMHLLSQQCVMHFAPGKLRRIVGMLMETETFGVRSWVDEQQGETLIFVLAPDSRGLFASLAAILTSGHANIVAAQAYTLADGRALDVFYLQGEDGAPFDIQSDLQRIEEKIQALIDGKEKIDAGAEPRVKINVLMRQVPVRVRELPDASSHETAIEVSAADHPGLLARLSDVISRAGYDLHGASISTFGERIVDVFFITGNDSSQLSTEQIADLSDKLARIATLPEE
ncbi:MAG TPA: [protein-PII] uridylyltransferase [Mariprofundaceae bacterium]|nr:[protein-PII] uridylyltransferase [Mariprofundaceae bacterium]